MKRLLTLVAFFATLHASAQQVNPVPDYVFRNQMSVGRNAVTDTAAYFSIGPRYGANKGFMPPIVVDTATFSSGKRNGLLIFSVQKNKFLYWDSVRVQWSDMAGSSGSYITGSGITGYLPQFNGTTTIDTSALFTLGNRLGIGSSTFAYNSTNTANVELNGTAGGILGFKRNDSARGYLWHTGDNMELANTVAGSISFNTNSATRGSISSAGVWRLHNLAGTGDRVVVASSNGTLSASTSVTGLVDTLTISTRAWRQKGIDSVVSIIPAAGVGGSGTTNYVPKFTAGSTIGNSQIVDNAASGVSIGAKTLIRDDGPFITGSNISGGANNMAIGTPTSGGFLSAYTNATERLRITSGGNVGIGTTTAGGKLTINSALGDHIQIQRSGQTDRAIVISGSDQLVFGTWASPTQMVLASNGRLLLNTTTDAGYQLDVSGTFRATGQIRSDANFLANSAAPTFNATLNTADAQRILMYMSGTDGVLQVTRAGGTQPNMIFSTEGGERMRLKVDGEFLIATTTDAGDYKLQVSGNIYNTGSAVLAATSGNVGIGTASPATYAGYTTLAVNNATNGGVIDIMRNNSVILQIFGDAGASGIGSIANVPFTFKTNNTEQGRINPAGEFLLNSTNSDAGDYKLQVSGNALVTAGKLDITTNTAFGLSVTRSGTSVVAGQINNSNGILYYGAESSTGGGLFTGSSAYAAVIGSGANYPLQFASNNITRATLNTSGELQIGSTSDVGDYKLQVIGNGYFGGSITTNAPDGGNAKPWKLGSVIATTVILDTANYVEVEINGVAYKLALVTPN